MDHIEGDLLMQCTSGHWEDWCGVPALMNKNLFVRANSFPFIPSFFSFILGSVAQLKIKPVVSCENGHFLL